MRSEPLIRRIEDESALAQIVGSLRGALPWIHGIPSNDLLDLLDAYGNRLAVDPKVTHLEGIAYLVFWLRRENLERLLNLNLTAGKSALDQFVEVHGATIRAQPAGLVCHWVAGNVPTLSLFSWILALIVKNVSLIRVSSDTKDAVECLLQVLQNCSEPAPGNKLMQTGVFVHFDHENVNLHRAMSVAADCKVIWGGADAVQQITALQRMDHCNEIVFGPKYSLGVLSRCVIETDDSLLQEYIRAFVRDIVLFDQRACSSPQTIFFEKSKREAKEIMERFEQSFQRIADSAPKREIDPFTALQIYNTRAEWGLSQDRDFRASRGADWTVCLDREPHLKTAVQSRCIFLTEIQDLMDTVPLMNPKIQTIGTAIHDPARFLEYADAVTLRGVSRCVKPGLMNAYDLPWDGKMVLSEMVRWVSIKR